MQLTGRLGVAGGLLIVFGLNAVRADVPFTTLEVSVLTADGGRPISQATVTVANLEGRVVQTRVSGLDGRVQFSIPQGRYIVGARRDYRKPDQLFVTANSNRTKRYLKLARKLRTVYRFYVEGRRRDDTAWRQMNERMFRTRAEALAFQQQLQRQLSNYVFRIRTKTLRVPTR